MGTTNVGALGIVPEELNEDNYEYWNVCLKSYLVGQGLWDVVTQDVMPQNVNTQKYKDWERTNALALHAIQLACGPRAYSKYKKENHISAKYAWDHLAQKHTRPRLPTSLSPVHEDEESSLGETGKKSYQSYKALYKKVKDGKWKEIKEFLDQEPDAIKAEISSHGDTALHIAIMEGHTKIAEDLVGLMSQKDLEKTNEFGATALSLAAISGETKLAKAMVERNKNLVTIANEHDEGLLPIIVASEYGKRNMVEYLYSVTRKEVLNPEKGTNGATLLNCLITAEFFDVASKLLKVYPHLGVAADHHGNYTLRILAQKPSIFPSGSKPLFRKNWIYSCAWGQWNIYASSHMRPPRGQNDEEDRQIQISNTDEWSIDIHENDDEDNNERPQKVQSSSQGIGWTLLRYIASDIKHIHDRKMVNAEAIKLLSFIFNETPNMTKAHLEKMEIDQAIYDAIEHGIVEFVTQILEYNPELIWRKDKKGRTIFAHAIVLRQEEIFSLIYSIGAKNMILARRHDIFGNNFLHLAAKLSPPSRLERVSGAALQMQRELQWFKEVESLVQPKCKEEVNENNRIPSALFTEEHKQLANEGEKWMKSTARSSMIVGTLIAAVMFTTAFTVPGGNDDKTGLPIMLRTDAHAFLIFSVSNGLSMFTSSTSVLMFLGILTARYAEKDFLKSLPTKLIFGLFCLFFSIVTMTVAFGSASYLVLHQKLHWVFIPIIVFCSFPVFLFSVLQFPLLIEMIYRTYGPGIFDKAKRHYLMGMHPR